MQSSSILREGTRRLRLPSLFSEELGLLGSFGASVDGRRGIFSISDDTNDVLFPSSPILRHRIEQFTRQLVQLAPHKTQGGLAPGGNLPLHYSSRFSYSTRSNATRIIGGDGTFASQVLTGSGTKCDSMLDRRSMHTSSMARDDGDDVSKKKKSTRRRRKNTASSDEGKGGHSGELTAADDEPFSAITDKIPQRPMTVVEGTSYTLVIIAALGFAAAVLYAALSELVFSPKEYTCFSNALKRIEDDPRVTIRLGTPLSAYGTESRNRSARQRIPHRIYNDDQGREHVQIHFHAKGPSGRAMVHADMYQEDGSWKYHYLYLNVESPLPQQVVLIRPFQPDNE